LATVEFVIGRLFRTLAIGAVVTMGTLLFGVPLSMAIWKTTGRLKILNFEDLTQHCKNLTFDVLCDLHNLPWVGSGNWHQRHHMDLRVFAFRQSAYNSVFGGLWRTQTTVLDAEFFYHRVRKSYNDVQVIPRFPVQLQLQGISGRHQRDYATRTQRAKDAVRRVSRKLAPWLWL
jgi:hypothetical protein